MGAKTEEENLRRPKRRLDVNKSWAISMGLEEINSGKKNLEGHR